MPTTLENTMAKLDADKRNELERGQFAFPKQRKEPLENASHVRNAIARFNQVEGVSDSERDEAWKHITAAAKKFGVEVKEKSWRGALPRSSAWRSRRSPGAGPARKDESSFPSIAVVVQSEASKSSQRRPLTAMDLSTLQVPEEFSTRLTDGADRRGMLSSGHVGRRSGARPSRALGYVVTRLPVATRPVGK